MWAYAMSILLGAQSLRQARMIETTFCLLAEHIHLLKETLTKCND